MPIPHLFRPKGSRTWFEDLSRHLECKQKSGIPNAGAKSSQSENTSSTQHLFSLGDRGPLVRTAGSTSSLAWTSPHGPHESVNLWAQMQGFFRDRQGGRAVSQRLIL